MDNPKLDIKTQLNSDIQKRREQNRLKIKLILKTIILCGKENIRLRDHCDSLIYEIFDSCSQVSLFYNSITNLLFSQ